MYAQDYFGSWFIIKNVLLYKSNNILSNSMIQNVFFFKSSVIGL